MFSFFPLVIAFSWCYEWEYYLASGPCRSDPSDWALGRAPITPCHTYHQDYHDRITINILMINNNFMIIIVFGSLWLGPRESSYYSTSLWSRLAWSSWLPWWSIPSPSSSLWDPSDWALRESSYYSLSHSQLYCFPSCISSTHLNYSINLNS